MYEFIFPPTVHMGSLPPQRSHQHVSFLVFLLIVILTGETCDLIVVSICISLMISEVEYLPSHVHVGPSVCLLWENIHILCPFFDQVICILPIVISVPYIFWTLTLYQIHDSQRFSPMQLMALIFCWWFPLLCRGFLNWYSPAYLFFFLLPVLLGSSPRRNC